MKGRRLRVLTNSRLGVRGSALLTLGVFHVIYSVQQLFPRADWMHRPDVVYRDGFGSPQAFGILWLIVGVLCIASSVTKRDGLGFGTTAALFMFWAVTELGAQLDGDASNGYTSAANWATFGVLTLILSRIQEPTKIESYAIAEDQMKDGDST